MTTTLTIGQRITAGSGDDRDSGTIDRIDGDQVTVRRDQGIVTTQPAAALVGDEQDADDELRLTDAYRVIDACDSALLSTHSTLPQAVDAVREYESHKTRPVAVVEELIDGRWVSAH